MTAPHATAPSSWEIDAESNATRKAVLAAMARMLAGTPAIVRPGLLSKAGLAREAQVDRNHITQGSCRDLGDRLAALADQRAAPATAREAAQQTRIDQLTAQLRQLTDTHATLRNDRDRWQAATHTLLRAIQVVRLEQTDQNATIQALRAHLAIARHGPGTGLVALPSTDPPPRPAG